MNSNRLNSGGLWLALPRLASSPRGWQPAGAAGCGAVALSGARRCSGSGRSGSAGDGERGAAAGSQRGFLLHQPDPARSPPRLGFSGSDGTAPARRGAPGGMQKPWEGWQNREVGFSPSGAVRRVRAKPLSATRRGAAPAQLAGLRSRTEARFHSRSCAAAQNRAELRHLLKFGSTASFYTQGKCYA